jgi:hypothetical protein
MSQILACKTESGILLAADSKAVDFTPQGEMVPLQVSRLTQLTPHSAILAGGAAAGEGMCRSLKEFLAKEKLIDIEEVYAAALPFLATEYERFMRKTCAFLPIDPIHHVHFILGGYSGKNTQKPFQLHLMWNKKSLPQLDGDEIASVFSVPRLISLEYRLSRAVAAAKAPRDLLPDIRQSLEKQSTASEDIAGPFAFGIITRAGFEKVPA